MLVEGAAILGCRHYSAGRHAFRLRFGDPGGAAREYVVAGETEAEGLAWVAALIRANATLGEDLSTSPVPPKEERAKEGIADRLISALATAFGPPP